MFRLQKWYLDLVTDDGTVFIGYVARLAWGAVRVRWASTLQSAVGAPPVEAATLRTLGAITRDSDSVSWNCSSLGVEGRWEGTSPPVRHTLWRESRGTIRWSCLCPSAQATVQAGDTRLEGRGYAERLTLTLRPWQLPFDTLWWGRYATAQNAVTWIVWQGQTRRSWVWMNGALQPEAELVEEGVEGLDHGVILRLDASRDFQRRRVLESIAAEIPAMTKRLGGRLSGLREHKRVSRAALLRDGEVADRGWAIHEEVTW